ncbi:DNA repair protein RecO [Aquisalinus flavus]|uniref:DNA repair protein RecO n=1 Tax=Aquisalinus flavus TaxID=1526572 RepID=A0A8J2V784_9PROT|nr:DNA repair protein RecO [Aquisalinus flavus]MBD0427674.1 DNA repair protein RecO [Aquisalinus flavus]UNE47456.1 DNA repair protein RecO [Aquisalinus flavus]GGD02926.1 DNA repair protein RecO [Aquisalinus flavus]
MQFTDEGIVLSAQPHGENHAVVNIFTPSAGRVAALVHGGQGKTRQPVIQQGNTVSATWKGRTEDSLGHFSLELVEPRAATLMQDALALTGLTAATSLLSLCLPERQSLPQLYDATKVLFDLMEDSDVWPVIMVKWELGLLAAVGYGLILDRCVASGATLEDGADLTFVSPRSGGAVSYDAGMPYKDRLLPLPPFLIARGEPDVGDMLAGFALTGHFLEERILFPADRQLPDARQRLLTRLKQKYRG